MFSQSITVSDNPTWLPESLKNRTGEVRHAFRFSAAERKIYQKRKQIPVSEWAERHRYVTRGPLEGTRFKKTTVPFSCGIMDASFFPGVEEIVLCAADQVSKSFIVDTCLGYASDRAPGPALVVYPDENTTTENIEDRLIPMFKTS